VTLEEVISSLKIQQNDPLFQKEIHWAIFEIIGQKNNFKSLNEMYLRKELSLDSQDMVVIKNYVTNLSKGIPLQYVVRSQYFLNHIYYVDEGVLIPRPETEGLVLAAASFLRNRKTEFFFGLEIGIGSGVISIELLSEFENLKMHGMEYSAQALKIAQKNAVNILKKPQNLILEKALERESVYPKQTEKFDFIVSNPPYVSRTDFVQERVSQYEPHAALYPPGDDALFFYKKFALEGSDWLNKNGAIFLEIPHERSEVILKLFQENNWNVVIENDLNNFPRVLIATLKAPKELN